MGSITRIAVDVMGGDHGPGEIVRGALAAASEDPAIQLSLVGDAHSIELLLVKLQPAFSERIRVVASSEVIEMSDRPSHALRRKPDSSMRRALQLVASGDVDACVSCGNTGALVALSSFTLGTLPNIKRPAILAAIPSNSGTTVMLDLGANVVCTARNLAEFAIMGAATVQSLYAIDAPAVGLLNIGKEAGKGMEVHAEADQMLTDSDLNYVGFVEGTDMFSGAIDVVVCDGYAGNIALKTIEGFANFMLAATVQLPGDEKSNKLTIPDPRTHNGATLIGLQGVVVKSHGHADEMAVKHAVETASAEVKLKLLDRVTRCITRYHANKGEAACTAK